MNRAGNTRDWFRLLSILAVASSFFACSSLRNSASEGASSGPNRLVVSELSSSVTGLSAYDLVEQHRSVWLERRGRKSIRNPTPIKVYVDGGGSPFGPVSSLKDIQATDVKYIQYFDAQQAQMRFGLDNSSGAILVNTKGGL